MKSTTLAMSVVALAGIAAGAALVRTVSVGESRNAGYAVSRPAAQASGDYVFACVNSSGKIDYLEFRLPLPHQCWFSGETLWHLAAVPAVDPLPSASPSPSPSLSVSAPASPTAVPPSSSPAAGPVSSSASPSAAPTSTPGH